MQAQPRSELVKAIARHVKTTSGLAIAYFQQLVVGGGGYSLFTTRTEYIYSYHDTEAVLHEVFVTIIKVTQSCRSVLNIVQNSKGTK